jgi:excisionase family DNA binding protein
MSGKPPAATSAPETATTTKTATTRLLSLQQAAAELGMSVWTLRDLIGAGELRAVQPPGVRRIYLDRRDVERAIEAWKS